ncbi:alpha/beta fold hydrolase [Rubrivivax albus]|uniref:Alpha/beta fold hydrolase n=1 Tax=Rubrivivax albus TaxID=2499835 RepID=A0A437JTX8_9BURK|nr:alpha/beta fold hydrolase [Rubrivivax albus]
MAFTRSGPSSPTGRPVILLHGIGGGKAIWAGSVAALAAAGFDAISVDLSGYGDSQGVAPGGMPVMAQAVLATMDALGLDRAALVGHSMGGMVAQEVAAVAPRRVSALVLACTSPAFGKPDGDWQARFVASRLQPLDAGQGMPGLAAALVPPMLGPAADPAGAALAARVMAAVPEATYRAVLAAIVSFDRRAALPAIAVPTLCLAGEHDRTAPPKVLRGMAERIPGARYAELAGAGHIANVETPAAFDAAVTAFLNEVLP